MSLRPWTLLACVLLLASCAASGPAGGDSSQAPAQPDLSGPAETLPELLFRSRASQSFDDDLLYVPPPDSALGRYAFQLARQPATLILFDQARAFQATDQSLAVSLADGSLRLYGQGVCAGLTLPGGPASLVSWLPGSRWLAAADAQGENLLLADVQSCRLEWRRVLAGPVTALAVSPSGTWLAAADAANGLWRAALPGTPERVALLPASCLALGFSQGDGVLQAACADGSVLLYVPSRDEALRTFRVPGGPFQAARFSGNGVEFRGPGERVEVVDLATGRPSGLGRQETGFALRDGVLTYRTWYNAPQQRLLPGQPGLAAQWSSAAAQVRVREPDGGLRCFAAADGRPAPCADAQDWRDAPLDQDARFRRKGREYVLADRVFQLEHARLLCRFVPGQGFYLWWVRAERPDSVNPLQGHLPVRETLDPEETVRWIPLNPPRELP